MRDHGLAYLAHKERTGKTLTAILTAEESLDGSVLIVTKKKAIKGWEDTLKAYPCTKSYTIINYESVQKVIASHDLVILDEAHHAISSTGKTSSTWKNVRVHTKKKPILYLSATPYSEHIGLLYNQLALSDYSPFKEYSSFFKWYAVYGIPCMVRTPYGMVDQRTKYHTAEVFAKVQHLFSFLTRQDVGIEHEPEHNLIEIQPSENTKKLVKTLLTKRVLPIDNYVVVADSDIKMRTIHYQLEGGTIKDNNILTGTTEKIDYIKANYDTSAIAIMAHFINERELLARHFPDALILSSDGDAEGVDLSHIDKMIIYSMSFKTSKHTQRMARQANHNRTKPILVDVLTLSAPCIGSKIYESVAIKEENFVKNSYEKAIK